jgi:GNAT superfamily N-acetyltransferase
MLTIRRAREDEGAALSELCLRSKAVWGYDNAFMQACRRELILTNAAVRSPDIRVADHNGQPVGVVELRFNNEEAELEKLFVEPAMMKTGVGRQLLDWAIEAARAKGATVLRVESDPAAAAFYRRMGALDDGDTVSGSIPGRRIPKLKIRL